MAMVVGGIALRGVLHDRIDEIRGGKMPNSTQHFVLGALTGAAAYVIIKKAVFREEPTLEGVLGWGLAGGVVATVPDALEPAVSPRHRGFAHSGTMLGLLAYANVKAFESQELTPAQKTAIGTLSLSLASHPIADSATPAGIPLY